MRICLVCEDLAEPFNEGKKRFAFSLLEALAAKEEVLGISTRTKPAPHPRVRHIPANRLFLSGELRSTLRDFAPRVICYAPSSAATLASFLRARVLSLYWPEARVAIISLQPIFYSFVDRLLIPYLLPDLVFIQSSTSAETLAPLGCPFRMLPGGVDMDRFVPPSPQRKAQLRERYGLPSDAFLTLHVGHVRRNRNLQLLARIARRRGYQALLLGSTAFGEDEALLRQLREAGVRVITDYIPHVEEIYQLADCYLFPITARRAAIDVPLSVLEAMACNLPVITTRYGGLPLLFEEGHGFFYADSEEEMLAALDEVRTLRTCSTRQMARPFDWKKVAERFLDSFSRTGR